MIQIISGIIILVSIAYYKTGPPIQNFSILNAEWDVVRDRTSRRQLLTTVFG